MDEALKCAVKSQPGYGSLPPRTSLCDHVSISRSCLVLEGNFNTQSVEFVDGRAEESKAKANAAVPMHALRSARSP